MNIDLIDNHRYWLMTPELYDKTKYFKNYKIESWGDPFKISVPLVFWLDKLRELARKPVNINCAYEIAGHNPSGYHPKGMAADIHIKNMPVVDQLLLALKLPFNGIGVYPFWYKPGLHLDIRPLVGYKRVWWRDKRGVYHNLTSISQIT